MTPIESIHDVRLASLIGLAINVIETLAISKNQDPDTILAEHLYLAEKYINSLGTDVYIDKLVFQYPLLEEAIK